MDHFFVSARDGQKTISLLGPFIDENKCKEYAYGEKSRDVINACHDIDPKSHFYEYGMFKVTLAELCPFNYRGLLNRRDPEKWDVVLQ